MVVERRRPRRPPPGTTAFPRPARADGPPRGSQTGPGSGAGARSTGRGAALERPAAHERPRAPRHRRRGLLGPCSRARARVSGHRKSPPCSRAWIGQSREAYVRQSTICPGSTRVTSSSSSTTPSVSTNEDSSPAPSRGKFHGLERAIPARRASGRAHTPPRGLLAIRELRPDRDGGRRRPLRAGQSQDRRPRDARSHEARDGIARQADERRAVDDAHRHGAARLHRDAPEDQRADAFHGGLDVSRPRPSRRRPSSRSSRSIARRLSAPPRSARGRRGECRGR